MFLKLYMYVAILISIALPNNSFIMSDIRIWIYFSNSLLEITDIESLE